MCSIVVNNPILTHIHSKVKCGISLYIYLHTLSLDVWIMYILCILKEHTGTPIDNLQYKCNRFDFTDKSNSLTLHRQAYR